MRKIQSMLLSVAALGLFFVFTGALSGCDSRPGDGAMVQDGAKLTAEEKAKVKERYESRKKNTANSKAPRKK